MNSLALIPGPTRRMRMRLVSACTWLSLIQAHVHQWEGTNDGFKVIRFRLYDVAAHCTLMSNCSKLANLAILSSPYLGSLCINFTAIWNLVHAGSISFSCHGVFSRWSREVLWRTSLDLSSGKTKHNNSIAWFENLHCLSFRLVEVKTFHMMVSVACLFDCVLSMWKKSCH